jgi:hypothetical protein
VGELEALKSDMNTYADLDGALRLRAGYLVRRG